MRWWLPCLLSFACGARTLETSRRTIIIEAPCDPIGETEDCGLCGTKLPPGEQVVTCENVHGSALQERLGHGKLTGCVQTRICELEAK